MIAKLAEMGTKKGRSKVLIKGIMACLEDTLKKLEEQSTIADKFDSDDYFDVLRLATKHLHATATFEYRGRYNKIVERYWENKSEKEKKKN